MQRCESTDVVSSIKLEDLRQQDAGVQTVGGVTDSDKVGDEEMQCTPSQPDSLACHEYGDSNAMPRINSKPRSPFHISNCEALRCGHRHPSDRLGQMFLQLQSYEPFTWNYSAWGLATFSTVVAVFTVIYAWNATTVIQSLQRILWENPQTTILTINILSHITVLLLDVLISTSCENLRWMYCTRPNGLALLDFLALSGSTSVMGLFQILTAWPIIKSKTWRFKYPSGLTHRLWSATR